MKRNNYPVQNDNALRVLQVTQFLDIGGLETMVMELSNQLKKKGVLVDVLCLNEVDEKYVSVLRENNISIHVIHEQSRKNILFYTRVARFIRLNNYNVIHAHSGCHFNAAVFSRIAGVKKVIFTAHGMLMFARFRDRLEDMLAAFLTSDFISVSDEIELSMKRWIKFPLCKFKTIINGVSTDKFKPIVDLNRLNKLLTKYHLPRDRILFGSVGRLAAVKNYAMALHAVRRLVNAGLTNICFVLVGEGSVGEDEQEQYLRDLVDELEISEYVCFLGMQYNIHEILPLFRFFILSSLTEGTSISLLESQACGIPAVVTDVGGNSKVVTHSENGFLCPSKDDRKMAEYMQKLIENSELAETMGAAARQQVVRDFSIEAMTEQYLKVYARATCRKRA